MWYDGALPAKSSNIMFIHIISEHHPDRLVHLIRCFSTNSPFGCLHVTADQKPEMIHYMDTTFIHISASSWLVGFLGSPGLGSEVRIIKYHIPLSVEGTFNRRSF